MKHPRVVKKRVPWSEGVRRARRAQRRHYVNAELTALSVAYFLDRARFLCCTP